MGRTSDARERLMAAAVDLIWEESYGAVTIDDICLRADVRKGSFYYFFESKAVLAVFALDRLWGEVLKPHYQEIFAHPLPLVRITGYFDFLYSKQIELKQKYGKTLGCPFCSVGSEICTQEESIRDKVQSIGDAKRSYFKSAIEDAVAMKHIPQCNLAEKTDSLIAIADGLLTQARIINNPEILLRLPSMAFDLLRVSSHPYAEVLV
ncbi:MAG: TetR/AcrR family transcriptional regulator [Verrucomicrobiota bacterium]|jgi:TetR/AcrR family transcriptional repressor of nem operon|nr:MAG: TetR/AcrR family transcriptional regulator [Verrucomicrobiota bacterium]